MIPSCEDTFLWLYSETDKHATKHNIAEIVGLVSVGRILTEPVVLRSEHSEQEMDVMFRRQQAAQWGAFKCDATWAVKPRCTRRDFFFLSV